MSESGDEKQGTRPQLIILDDRGPYPPYVTLNDIPPGQPVWLSDLIQAKLETEMERMFLEAVRIMRLAPASVPFSRMLELLLGEWWRSDPEHVPFPSGKTLGQVAPVVRAMWEREAKKDPAFTEGT